MLFIFLFHRESFFPLLLLCAVGAIEILSHSLTRTSTRIFITVSNCAGVVFLQRIDCPNGVTKRFRIIVVHSTCTAIVPTSRLLRFVLSSQNDVVASFEQVGRAWNTLTSP